MLGSSTPIGSELEGYDPNTNPLFIGTSVVPYVNIHKPLAGADAGKFLQADVAQPKAPGSASGPPDSK